MTMIASAISKNVPLIVADLLVSEGDKPQQFVLPALQEDILKYLKGDTKRFPVSFTRKLYIIQPNVCVAFAGTLSVIKKFFRKLKEFCRGLTVTTADLIGVFIKTYENDTPELLEYIILVAEMGEEDNVSVKRFMQGSAFATHSEIYGQVTAFGSGARQFISKLEQISKLISESNSDAIEYGFQANYSLLAQTLATESVSLDTIHEHWGGGFEAVFLDGDTFARFEELTYIVFKGRFDQKGNIDSPVPAVIMHYKYYGEILTICSIATHKGQTKRLDKQYTITCEAFDTRLTIIAPMDYDGPIDTKHIVADTSFVSHRAGMGYILQSATGAYFPGNFYEGPELTITNIHAKQITIEMADFIHNDVADVARKAFPSFASQQSNETQQS